MHLTHGLCIGFGFIEAEVMVGFALKQRFCFFVPLFNIAMREREKER